MASTSDNLYVTFVDIDRDLLKVWGQRNRIGATYIERQLLQLLPDFNRAHSPNSSEIYRGMFCFAKYTDDNYYRARVISGVQNDSVGVLFVDYGNRDVIQLSNIRIQEGKEGDVLAKMSEQAEEYYLARIAAPTIGWTKEIVSEIRRDICYDEFLYNIAAQVGDQKILEIQFHGEDFSNYLVKKKLASPLSLPVQRQMILSCCSLVSNDSKAEPAFKDLQRMTFTPPVPPVNIRTSFSPSNEGMVAPNYGNPKTSVNFTQPHPGIHYPSPQQINPAYQQIKPNIPKNVYFSSVNHPSGPVPATPSPPQPVNPVLNPLLNNQFNPLQLGKENANPFNCNSNIIQLLAQQVKQYIAEDNAKTEFKAENIPHHYVNSVLEVGSTYNVITSYIDDGPWSFSIQLMSSETELRQLMDELTSAKLVPIKPPIILGHPCIASSALYGNLCRGVVVSISHSAVKVYFVDFGNTEDLPASSIYELPPKFFKIRVLSQKFSLSGLQKVAYSDDIRKFFKEVVQDELLMLRVTSLEDDNLPTCELYLKNVNIKRILNEKIREQRNSIQEYFPKVGDTEDIVVTWVVSPQKFFIQLRKRDADLKALKEELAEVDKNGQRLTYQQLSVGFKCVCRYESDRRWYRAVITSVDSEDSITVFYVDYGNAETVNISLLRRVDSSVLINQMNNQAIQCSLKGFENKQFDQELVNKFEALVLEKEFQMTVVSSEKELLCVQLMQNQQDISVQLLNATSVRLESFDTSSSSRDDVWYSPSTASSVANFEREKVSENLNLHEKKDNRSFRSERARDESKSSRLFNHFQRFKYPVHSTPIQSKRRFEGKENWREDKDKNNRWNEKSENQNTWKPRIFKSRENAWESNANSKFGGNRGPKQGRDDWGESSRIEKNRSFKQDRTRDGWDNKKEYNFGDRRKFDENRGNREAEKRRIGKRFERSRSRESWIEEETKLKVDRNDDMIPGSDKPKSLRKPIRKEEAAPPGSKFEDRVVNIGSCENGIVTYYFSPDEFYVQLLAQEQEFTTMMKDIQKYYSDKYSIRDPLQAGDIVIAQFSLDKVLYRAEVIKPSPVTVCYVDYGNHEPVGPKSTWLVSKEFLKLPKQVIKCRLSNLCPIGSHWPPPGSAVDKFFSLSEYKCTFLSKENDMYEISMEDPNGKDVASEIIAGGFGRKMVPKLDVPEIDFSLLPNQVLRLYVSHVESSSKFYVILNPEGSEAIENELKTLRENKKNLMRLREDLIKPETVCLSTNDEISWYRGRIVKTDGNKILVWFSDRGDSVEVTRDKLMSLPDYLAVFQPQAVQCSLHGASVVRREDFKQAIEYKHHLTSIVAAENGSLSVILYNEDGKKYDFQNSDDFPQVIEPMPQLPIISQKLPVFLSHFENPKEIYIQRSADWNELNNISELIGNFYLDEKEGFDIEEEELEGMLMAANSVAYENWYRARLVSSSEEGLEVFYVDFGNKEILPRERVKKLESLLLSLPALTRKFALDVEFNPEKIEDIKNYLLSSCNNKEVLGYFKNYNGEFILEIVVDGERISRLLKSVGLALMNSPDKFADVLSGERTQPTTEPSASDAIKGLRVLISHIDNPKQFWVHKETAMNDLHQFQDKLKKKCEVLPGRENIAIGDIVAALFSDTWYRAKVTDVEGESIKVQFIDYGNTINVDLTSSSVKELTDEFLNVPVFATPFALKGNWSENSTAKFEEIILQNEDFITAVVLEESDPAIVDLFQNGQSIAELLMEEELDSEDDREFFSVYIAYFHSPSDFYVHRETCSGIYNKISERLSDVSVFSDALPVEEGEMYVAKFPEDGGWYRARVVKKDGDEIEAHFVDYGNTSNVTEIKHLPRDLIDIPGLAENCCLAYGDSNDSWSEAACEKFAELVDGRELKMKVVAKNGKKSVVELLDGNSSITKELERLCENDERSEVYVSYATSPSDFYIQYVDDESYKLISDKLNGEDEDLEEKIPGTLCQACFADDGRWYRARILQNLEEGCEVFFIDFGNISVSTDIKKLPPEIEDIPPRAVKCTLDLPETNVPESVKEEFITLAAGGATVYKARVIVPGEVNVISLKLNGRLLEETLNTNVIAEGNSFGFGGHTSAEFPQSETDDGKNSKKNYDDYLISDLSDDLRNRESVLNETDEEKRVKFAHFDGSEGFKSDDEKGTPSTGFVNATDNELMEEVRENENFLEARIDEPRDNIVEVVKGEESFKIQDGVSDRVVNGNSNEVEDVDTHKASRNKVHKIVPGSISRGVEEFIEASTLRHSKLKYSENLVPGSISRGISLESMTSESYVEVPEKQISKSTPNTPKLERRAEIRNYVKIDPNDRLSLHCSSASERIPKSDKVGALNGSIEDS